MEYNRGGADRLADLGRGGGRGSLGGNSGNTADFELGRTSGDVGDSELVGTSENKEDLGLGRNSRDVRDGNLLFQTFKKHRGH